MFLQVSTSHTPINRYCFSFEISQAITKQQALAACSLSAASDACIYFEAGALSSMLRGAGSSHYFAHQQGNPCFPSAPAYIASPPSKAPTLHLRAFEAIRVLSAIERPPPSPHVSLWARPNCAIFSQGGDAAGLLSLGAVSAAVGLQS